MKKRYLLPVLATAVLVVCADQSAKVAARGTLPVCSEAGTLECDGEALMPGIGLLRIENAGTTAMATASAPIANLVTVAGLALGALYAYSSRRRGAVAGLVAGLLVGGASGNLIDRAAFGSVTDFLAVADYYVVNVADLAMLSGLRSGRGGGERTEGPRQGKYNSGQFSRVVLQPC